MKWMPFIHPIIIWKANIDCIYDNFTQKLSFIQFRFLFSFYIKFRFPVESKINSWYFHSIKFLRRVIVIIAHVHALFSHNEMHSGWYLVQRIGQVYSCWFDYLTWFMCDVFNCSFFNFLLILNGPRLKLIFLYHSILRILVSSFSLNKIEKFCTKKMPFDTAQANKSLRVLISILLCQED